MESNIFPLIKGDITNSKADYRDALPVNMIAVQKDVLGAKGYLVSHSGLTQYATGIGADRGGYWSSLFAAHFRVSGTRLIKVASDGSITNIGAIAGNGRVRWADGFNTLLILSDGRCWLYDGSTINEIIDDDLKTPLDVTWVNGYYFFTDGENIYHTKLNDESEIGSLDFATSEFRPDDSLGVALRSDNQVAVFNRHTTEFFFNNPSLPNFKFQRRDGQAVKCGIAGTNCYTELHGIFYVLGGGIDEAKSIHAINSGQYQKVATREIDQIISEYTRNELEAAVLESRSEAGQEYILVRLLNHTLLFNKTISENLGLANAWTILKDSILGDGPWRGVNGVFDGDLGRWVYGDSITNKIAVLDENTASIYGEEVETILYSPMLKMDGRSINEIEIETAAGQQKEEENIITSLSLTYDGATYGSEYFKLHSQKGNYSTRYIIRRLGCANDIVGFKIRTVSKDKVNFCRMRVQHG